MIHELRAVVARVNALGIPCHIGQVPTGTPVPYASVTGPAHDVGDDLPLGGPHGTIDTDRVRVKVVDSTDSNTISTLGQIRADLSPNEHASALAVAGRSAVIVWVRSEGEPYVDRDSTLPSKVHPVLGVDTYRLVSQPT